MQLENKFTTDININDRIMEEFKRIMSKEFDKQIEIIVLKLKTNNE